VAQVGRAASAQADPREQSWMRLAMRLGLARLGQAQDSLVTPVGRSGRAVSTNTVSVSRVPLPSTRSREISRPAPPAVLQPWPASDLYHRTLVCLECVGSNPANATSVKYARHVHDAANVSR
jgi:hypothetical protein